MEKSKLNFLAVVLLVSLAGVADATVYEIAASQMSVADNPPQPSNVPTYHTDGAGYIRNSYWNMKAQNSYHRLKATINLPSEMYNVYVRCHQTVAPSMYFDITTEPYTFYTDYITVDGAPDEDRWFIVEGEVWAYQLVQANKFISGGTHVLKMGPYGGTYLSAMHIDSMIFCAPSDGYATQAEAQAALPPPLADEFTILTATLATSPVRALDIGGTYAGNSVAMSYHVENGALVATGDMTWAQELEALELCTGRRYMADGENDIGPLWVSFGIGGRQFVNSDSFTLSEWAFSEVVYWERLIANGGSPGPVSSATMLSLWQSTNRFALRGDPLGDVGYRMYQAFAGASQ